MLPLAPSTTNSITLHVIVYVPTRSKSDTEDHCLLLMLTVVPVMSFVLAGEEIGEVVPLALHELEKVMGAVISLLHRQHGQIHLLLRGHHN